MQSHLDHAMYGERVNQEELTALANKQQEYYELVYTVFNTRAGKKLLKEFRLALQKPIFNENIHVTMMREGNREVLISLLESYERGAPK